MRPVLSLQTSSQELLLDMIATLGIFFCLLLPVLAWSALPDVIPCHFGVNGIADAWGSKWMLALLPGLGGCTYLVLSILGYFPHWFNYPWRITEQNAKQQYYLARLLLIWLKVEFMWLCCFLEWKLIQVALGRATGLGAEMLPLSLILVFGTLGFYWRQASLVR